MPVDRYGSPLPAGAVARMGNTRFRQVAPVTGICFTPDNKTLATAGKDSNLRLWEVATGKELRQFGIYDSAVNVLACSPDGKLLVTGESDGNLSFWDFETGADLRQVKGHPGGVLALSFTSDGETLLSGGADNIVRLWDPKSGEELGQFNENFGAFEVVAIAPDNTTLALGSWESTIRLCDIASGREVRQFRGPRVGVRSMVYSPDGRTLASGSVDGSLGIWELLAGKERRSFPKHQDGATCVAFSHDGRLMASAGADTTVLVWDVAGALVEKPPVVAPVQLPGLWDNLADDDAVKAHQSMRTLALAPRVAAPFLKERLFKLTPVDPHQVSRWIADLGNPQFATRELVTSDMEKLGALIEPALRAALAARPPLESRRRLERLLGKLAEPTPPAAVIQALRAIEALEMMNAPESVKVLEELSRRTPETRLTQEAQIAAQRLAVSAPRP